MPLSSPLSSLPLDLDKKQALFFDGLRHAYEISTLASTRLNAKLTEIALSCKLGPAPAVSYTEAFLDAWALVDSIDRFRSLWRLLPGQPQSDKELESDRLFSAVRKVRNVADHIAQRIDHVIAHNGSALGKLSWITLLSESEPRCIVCTLQPGHFSGGTVSLPDPGGAVFYDNFQTTAISIAAGEHTANLTEATRHLQPRIKHLEDALVANLGRPHEDYSASGSDLFAAGEVIFSKDLSALSTTPKSDG